MTYVITKTLAEINQEFRAAEAANARESGVPRVTARTAKPPRADAFAVQAEANAEPAEVAAEPAEVFAEQAEVFAEQTEAFAEPPEVFAAQTEVFTEPAEVFAAQADAYAVPPEVYAMQPEVFAARADGRRRTKKFYVRVKQASEMATERLQSAAALEEELFAEKWLESVRSGEARKKTWRERWAERGKMKKYANLVSIVLFYAALAALVVGVYLFASGGKGTIFGYTYMNVISSSMQSVLPKGSLVIVKEVDPKSIAVGNDITFINSEQMSVTHRVVSIMEDYEGTGERGFETKGVNNDEADFEIVQAANVVGVVKMHFPGVGDLLMWIRENPVMSIGFFFGCVLLSFLIKGVFTSDKGTKRRREPEEFSVSGIKAA
jgi:signal peptidase I